MLFLLINKVSPITGRNRTGPPCSVGRTTNHAPGPAAADRPRARPALPPAALQTTTDASQQNNIGPYSGPVINTAVQVFSHADRLTCVHRSKTARCSSSVVAARHHRQQRHSATRQRGTAVRPVARLSSNYIGRLLTGCRFIFDCQRHGLCNNVHLNYVKCIIVYTHTHHTRIV